MGQTWIKKGSQVAKLKLQKVGQKSEVDIPQVPPIRGSHLEISPILPPSIEEKKKTALPTPNGPTRPLLQKGQG